MEHVTIEPFRLATDAWVALCVRCDGSLVGSESDLDAKLCGLCLTGPVVEPLMPPNLKGEPHRYAHDMSQADPVIVDALQQGMRFDGPLWAERWTAALNIMRENPGMSRRAVAERVGVHVRAIDRLMHREYQKAQRTPLRAAVIEAMMSGRVNRINPTRYEVREAICRLIKQGATDQKIHAITRESISLISGHRHRMAKSGEFSLLLADRIG